MKSQDPDRNGSFAYSAATIKSLFIIATGTLLACLGAVAAESGPGNAIVLKGTDFFRTTLWSPALFPSKNFTFELWFNATSPGALIGEADTADVNRWDNLFAEVF